MRTSIPRAGVEHGCRLLRWVDGWSLAALLLALAVALPVLVVAGSLTQPAGDIWSHLASTVLGVADYAAIIVHGRIARAGAPSELRDELSKAYLGA